MQDKVSVVIPVYNVEKYLGQCLDSVINQTYRNLEIICVNDCSPDNSVQILKEYAQKDERIKIVTHEKNGGLSVSRNSGLDAATGDYVYFIDSDDWIDLDYIEKMVEAIKRENVDIVLNVNIICEYIDKQKMYPCFISENYFSDGGLMFRNEAINNAPPMIWSHLYKKNFFEKYHLQFINNTSEDNIKRYIHEDVVFQHESLTKTDKIYVFLGSAYHYRQNASGLMGRLAGSAITTINSYIKIAEFYKNTNTPTKGIKLIYPLSICRIYDDEEFQQLKKLFAMIHEHLTEQIDLYNDYEQYIIHKIQAADNYDEFVKTTNNNNINVLYLKEKLKKTVKK